MRGRAPWLRAAEADAPGPARHTRRDSLRDHRRTGARHRAAADESAVRLAEALDRSRWRGRARSGVPGPATRSRPRRHPLLADEPRGRCALQCPRYSVALAGADAPGTLAAIQTTLAAAYERDEYSQVGQVIEHDSFDENHGYLRVPFSVWAPDRSYGIGVSSGRVLDVMSTLAFQWFSPKGADQMIVLTYLQRCALR